MSFGTRLQAARKAKRLTQQKLAEKVDTTTMTISNWERDLVEAPDSKILAAVASVLDVSVDDLLQGERSPAPNAEPRLEPLGANEDIEIAIRRANLSPSAAESFRGERRLGGSAYPLEVLIAIAKERRAEELGRSTDRAQVEHVEDEDDAPRFR